MELYLSESIRVEARKPNRMGRFIVDSDEDMCHVFKQYNLARIENIEIFVEFFPIEIFIVF